MAGNNEPAKSQEPRKPTFSENLAKKRELEILYAYLDASSLKEKHPDITIADTQEKRISRIKQEIDATLDTKTENLQEEHEKLSELIISIRSFGNRVFGPSFLQNIDDKIKQDEEQKLAAAKTKEKQKPLLIPTPSASNATHVKIQETQTARLKTPSSPKTPSASDAAFSKPTGKDADALSKRINEQIKKIEKQKSPYQAQRLGVLKSCLACLEGKISAAELKQIEESEANKGYDKAKFYSEPKRLFNATMALLNKPSAEQKQEKSVKEKFINAIFRR